MNRNLCKGGSDDVSVAEHGVISNADGAHASGLCGFNTCLSIFEHYAVLGSLLQGLGPFQENFWMWFAVSNHRTIDDCVQQMVDLDLFQDEFGILARRAECRANPL